MNLAFLYPVPLPTMKPGPHWGAPFVSREFFRALFRYAPFDGYLFFSASQAEVDDRLEAIATLWGKSEGIEAYNVFDLPEILGETPIQALHAMGNHLHPLAYARSLVPDARFPVTCSAYDSPSTHWSLPEYGQDLVCGLMPGDTAICTSDASRGVFDAIFDHLSDQPLAGWLGEITPPDLAVIPPGVDTERYHPEARMGWRQRLHLPDDAFMVLGLGRLSAADKSDLKPVLRGFYRFLAADDRQKAPIYLVLAGSDYRGYGDELIELADALGLSDRVRLVLDPAEAEKPALLAEADCFLALSDNPHEAFGYSVLEALASGLPVVASDWNGLKETVTSEVGFRVPTYWGPAMASVDTISPLFSRREDDVMHLLAAQSVVVDIAAAWQHVARLRDDPTLCSTLGKAARARALEVYAWPSVIARHVDLWDQAAKTAARAEPNATTALQWPTTYQTAFRHYPTRWLDPATIVRRSPPTPLPPGAGIRPYADAKALLAEGFLEDLLHELAEPRTIAYLLERSDAEADIVYYHLLWMMKQGILQIDT